MLRSAKFRIAAIALATTLTFGAAAAAEVTGAGSSFVYPVLSKWSAAYAEQTGTRINYQSIGSGGGIAQIKAATVDFGASDKPLSAAELKQFGLGQFPVVIGGIVPVVNVPGVAAGAMKLDGATLADIYLGKITRWNDPAIAALNGGLKLPETKITVVHRSDGSGTTFNFTNYLSKVSPAWKSKVGEGTAVSWPAGIGAARFIRSIADSCNCGAIAAIYTRPTTLGAFAVSVITTPPHECPTRIVGPCWRASTRRVAATSSASEVSGFCTELT